MSERQPPPPRADRPSRSGEPVLGAELDQVVQSTAERVEKLRRELEGLRRQLESMRRAEAS